MNPNSKRYRRAVLRKIRRRRRRDLRWMKAAKDRHHQILGSAWSERHILYFNRASARLSCNLPKPAGGQPIIDGAVLCPICGTEWLTFGDPDEWTRNDRPRRSKKCFDVTGHWPGMAQCCGLLLAPDFEQQSVIIDDQAYRAAVGGAQ